METTTRVCTICNQAKPISHYTKNAKVTCASCITKRRGQHVLRELKKKIKLGDQVLNRFAQLSPLHAAASVPLQPTPRNHPTAGLPTHLQSMVRNHMIVEEELNIQRSHCVPGPGDYSAPCQHSNPGPIHLADSAWVRLHSRYSRLSVHR